MSSMIWMHFFTVLVCTFVLHTIWWTVTGSSEIAFIIFSRCSMLTTYGKPIQRIYSFGNRESKHSKKHPFEIRLRKL